MFDALKNFQRTVQLFARGMTSRQTPMPAKLVLLAGLVYLLVPTDIIPDVIPALGFSDDVLALIAAGTTFLKIANRVRASILPGEKGRS
jgi:uncharacterized membrane protein YkvA (DUF1232 family)